MGTDHFSTLEEGETCTKEKSKALHSQGRGGGGIPGRYGQCSCKNCLKFPELREAPEAVRKEMGDPRRCERGEQRS